MTMTNFIHYSVEKVFFNHRMIRSNIGYELTPIMLEKLGNNIYLIYCNQLVHMINIIM